MQLRWRHCLTKPCWEKGLRQVEHEHCEHSHEIWRWWDANQTCSRCFSWCVLNCRRRWSCCNLCEPCCWPLCLSAAIAAEAGLQGESCTFRAWCTVRSCLGPSQQGANCRVLQQVLILVKLHYFIKTYKRTFPGLCWTAINNYTRVFLANQWTKQILAHPLGLWSWISACSTFLPSVHRLSWIPVCRANKQDNLSTYSLFSTYNLQSMKQWDYTAD